VSSVVLVTGVAGFIGSHLAERLLAEGRRVRGVDCFTPYYDRAAKEANLAGLRGREGFEFTECDLGAADAAALVEGVDTVFHQAAQPGVRGSWGEDFRVYTAHNLIALHRLLEACRGAKTARFVFASSSSVYGDLGATATEDGPLHPISPYGVTKEAGERLVDAYHREYGLATVSLRYFTVCGPRQRPDMAFHKILRALYDDTPFPMLGDGSQTRDFTHVGDVVEANLLAETRGRPGTVYNVAGGGSLSLAEAVRLLEECTGRTARIERLPRAAGDPKSTSADLTRARAELGYEPRVPAAEALRLEATWYAGPEGPLARRDA